MHSRAKLLALLLGCLCRKPVYWIPPKVAPWRYHDLERQEEADARMYKASSECSSYHNAESIEYVL